MKRLAILVCMFSGCVAAEVAQVQVALDSSLSHAVQDLVLSSDEYQKLQAVGHCLFLKQNCDEAYRSDLVKSLSYDALVKKTQDKKNKAGQSLSESDFDINVLPTSINFKLAHERLLQQYEKALEQGLVVGEPLGAGQESDSVLITQLISEFNLDEAGQNLLRRFARWVQYKVDDQLAEALYFKILKCRSQQADFKAGFILVMRDPKTGENMPEETCVLNLPAQQAADRWLQNWEEDLVWQDLQKRLADLKAGSQTKPEQPSNQIDLAQEELILQDLQKRLAALKSDVDEPESSVESSSISSNSPKQDDLKISLNDNVVDLEKRLRGLGFKYWQLLNWNMVTKQAKLTLEPPSLLGQNLLDLKLMPEQPVLQAMELEPVVLPLRAEKALVASHLDLNNVVNLERGLLTLVGKSYRDLSQNMNFKQKKQALQSWLAGH